MSEEEVLSQVEEKDPNLNEEILKYYQKLGLPVEIVIAKGYPWKITGGVGLTEGFPTGKRR